MIKHIKKNIIFYSILIIIVVFLVFLLVNYNPFSVNNYDHKSLKCNHYKFKSDEEYEKRTTEYNKDGHMKDKLSDEMNNKWKVTANKIKNIEIQYILDELKDHIKKPLKNAKTINNIHNISVVTMFRFEDDYLDEFLHYYIMHGITHFYLYSNKNKENTKKVLQPYIDKGYVTLIEWDNHSDDIRKKWNNYHEESIQNLAFKDFNNNYKNQTKWIIKVDIDEFIYSSDKSKIKDILNNTSEINIKVPRIDFGSSNHIKKPDGLILENYTYSAESRSSIKSIALTKYISEKDNGSAHSFITK